MAAFACSCYIVAGQVPCAIDRRPFIAAATALLLVFHSIIVHRYGPHIFHTSDREAWDFVNSFVPFNNFINTSIAVAPDGKRYNPPLQYEYLQAAVGSDHSRRGPRGAQQAAAYI